jgi:hypothetical protein
MRTLIAATTAANTLKTFCVPNDRFVSLAVTGLDGTETINVEIDCGGTWIAPLPLIQFSTALTYMQVAGPCTYRVNKPITANPVAVFIED